MGADIAVVYCQQTPGKLRGKYIAEFGDESWELDALEPKVITDLIKEQVKMYRDEELYNAVCDREYQEKQELQMLVDHYDAAVGYLDMNF